MSPCPPVYYMPCQSKPPLFDRPNNMSLYQIMLSSVLFAYFEMFVNCLLSLQHCNETQLFSFLKKVLMKLQRSSRDLVQGDRGMVGSLLQYFVEAVFFCFKHGQLIPLSLAIKTSYFESRNNKSVNDVLHSTLLQVSIHVPPHKGEFSHSPPLICPP